MRCKILIFFLHFGVFSFACEEAPFWGQTGHRTIGEIAYHHLTKRAKKNIEKLLKEESVAMVSTYADEIKSDRKYREFSPWHYVNFNQGELYEASDKSPNGDLIYGIEECQKRLASPSTSNQEKIFYLKLLVHFVGDLHQPLHIGRAEDKGGNLIKVRWFRENTNLHSVWDTKMIESFNMGYSELAVNLNTFSKKQKEQMQRGDVMDWVYESRELATEVYQSAKNGENLSYRYMYDHFSTVKMQLKKAGLRLAKVLNELFG